MVGGVGIPWLRQWRRVPVWRGRRGVAVPGGPRERATFEPSRPHFVPKVLVSEKLQHGAGERRTCGLELMYPG